MELLLSPTLDRPERGDVLLQELVRSRNLKQALANVDKRLKKNGDLKVQVNRALILLSFEDESKRSQGRSELSKILNAKDPIIDIEVLRVVDSANQQLDGFLETEANAMWERAAASPNRQAPSVASEWFLRKFEDGDYRTAQKAAMLAMKHPGKTREGFMRAVVASHLVGRTAMPGVTSQQQAMFSTMAYKMLVRSAADTTAQKPSKDASRKHVERTEEGKTPLNPTLRTLQSADDVELMLHVFKTQGRSEEALNFILPDGPFKVPLLPSEWSWTLFREVESLLEQCGRWAALLHLCEEVLQEACHVQGLLPEVTIKWPFGAQGDDLVVWRAYTNATYHCQRSNSATINAELFEVLPKLNRRHFLLSQIQLRELQQSEDVSEKLLVVAMHEYFEAYRHTPMVFRDLKRPLSRLSTSGRIEFLSILRSEGPSSNRPEPSKKSSGTPRWVVGQSNLLKMQFCLMTSLTKTSDTKSAIQRLLEQCLILHEQSLDLEKGLSATERRCGDDLAILAAFSLLYLRPVEDSRTGAFGAALILERLLQSSPHNYDAILLLIRVYMHIGAVTRAVDVYRRLEIKNIQNLTLSWLILPRLSTLYPCRTRKHGFDPAAEVSQMVSWLNRAQDTAKQWTLEFLQEEEFCQLLSQLELRDCLTRSVSALVLRYEAAALVGDLFDVSSHLHVQEPQIVRDVGDYAAFPEFTITPGKTLLACLESGPAPKEAWCVYKSTQLLWRQVCNGAQLSPSARKAVHDFVSSAPQASDNPVKDAESAHSDLTKPEAASNYSLRCLWAALLELQTILSSSQAKTVDLRLVLASLDEAERNCFEIREPSVRDAAAIPALVHESLVRLDSMRMYLSVLTFAAGILEQARQDAASRQVRERLDASKTRATEVSQTTHKRLRTLQQELGGTEMVDLLSEDLKYLRRNFSNAAAKTIHLNLDQIRLHYTQITASWSCTLESALCVWSAYFPI